MALALACVLSVGCKDGSAPIDDMGMDASTPDARVDGSTPDDGGEDSAVCEGTICGMDCVDLDTDDANCGACGMPCGEAESCVQGLCEADPQK